MKTTNTPDPQPITATELLLGAAEHDALSSGYTLLDKEIVLGNIHNIERIIQQTPLAALSRPNGKGFTPLHAAVWLGNEYILDTLLKKGVKVDILDAQERTPLHWAAEFGNAQVIHFLLYNSAYTNHRNAYLKSTQDVADAAGYGETFRLAVMSHLFSSDYEPFNSVAENDDEDNYRVNIEDNDDDDDDDNDDDNDNDNDADDDNMNDMDLDEDLEGVYNQQDHLLREHHKHKRMRFK